MSGQIKSKHQALLEFCEILFRHNLMMLSCDNSLEYEDEALSILSRFTEGALHLASDEKLMHIVAVNIVKQTFDFWFNSVDDVDFEPLSRELVTTFRASFGITDEEGQNNS